MEELNMSKPTKRQEEKARSVVAEFHKRGNTGLTQLEFDIAQALAHERTRGAKLVEALELVQRKLDAKEINLHRKSSQIIYEALADYKREGRDLYRETSRLSAARVERGEVCEDCREDHEGDEPCRSEGGND
jgi:hypothetical protein